MPKNDKNKFTNIDAEKINIVEKDGTVRMTLFNGDNMPSLIMGGEDILPGHRQGTDMAGIMFYNAEGDECGGLIFGSQKNKEGGYRSGLSLTFDQYKQDQVLQMTLFEENGKRDYGFVLYDRPDNPITDSIEEMKKMHALPDGAEKDKLWQEMAAGNHERLRMGKSSDGNVSIRLNDSKGKPRIRMVIDANDVPSMEFLNEKGEVTYKLPPSVD